MRVPIKLLGFVVWLFSFNCGRCQDCLQENMKKYENAESLSKAKFSDGEVVRFKCQIGFTGSYKLKCVKGEWQEQIARSCAKKKCSHPGDATNGDFTLVEGTEFVFGATVRYTCKKGFEMASRVSQRTCRDGGWDNSVPICEAVKCPAIHTDGDMSATGNTEEGTYGDVIHFECLSSEKRIVGSKDIHCTEEGDWSHSVPICEEIKCEAPNITNGEVIDKQPEYSKDAMLKYRCKKGFKPREGTPKCASFGWTLNPECDAVTCKLGSTTYRVKSIKPEGQTIFQTQETVTITCTESSWFSSTKETIQKFTCQDDGEWDHLPACQEIKCETPYNQNVYLPLYYFGGEKPLGTEISYYCDSGYDNKAEKATCTRDGWTPKPLCEEIMCAAPEIPNTTIKGVQQQKYSIYSRIQYRCHAGFEPQELLEITCEPNRQWKGIRQCTKTCSDPNIPNAQITRGLRRKYTINSVIEYKCDPGFEPKEPVQITCDSQGQWTGMKNCTEHCRDLSVENGFSHSTKKEEMFYSCNTGYKPYRGKWWGSVTCSKGSWPDEPLCIKEKDCGALPSVHNGKLTPKAQGTAEVKCDPGFIATKSFIKCNNGTWETPACEVGPRCGIPPKVDNAIITSKPKDFYMDGSDVTYACRSSYQISGKSTIVCRNETWDTAPTCEGKILAHDDQRVTCKKPYRTYTKVRNEKESYNNDEVLRYECLEPYNHIPEGQLTCENGKWSGDFVCTSEICPPPPYVENGDYIIRKTVGRVITEVQYQCQRDYVMNTQQRYLTCEEGKWQTPPKCLKPCEITPEFLKEHNMQTNNKNVYLPHGYQQAFNCERNYYIKKTHSLSQYLKCFDGKLIFDPCERYE